MREALATIGAWSSAENHELFCDELLAQYMPGSSRVLPATEMGPTVDLLLALGGDGTLLRAARCTLPRTVPILGVNLGSLGFLTEVVPDELEGVLPRLSRGDYRREPRTVLSLSKRGIDGETYAVNEVTVDRGREYRAVELKLEANGQLVCRYVADGLIVATPTGSTAYALSAGGPVTVPQLRALVVAPVAPHTLAQRPIVFPDDVVLRVTSEEPKVEIAVTVDGQRTTGLRYHESCEIRRAPFNLELVRFPERDFYSLVRTKLHWGVDPRHGHRDGVV
jgi:NAD+ kinase